jgi:nicotinamidase-related amidase
MNKLEEGLRFGPLADSWVHLCIDMQRMFAEPTEWHTPWMERVLPNVVAVVELDPARTIFTRFIPAQSPEEVGGSWHRYYRRWETMTRNKLDRGLLDLVPTLARFVPPARLEDKVVMSAWHGTLHARLRQASIDILPLAGLNKRKVRA